MQTQRSQEKQQRKPKKTELKTIQIEDDLEKSFPRKKIHHAKSMKKQRRALRICALNVRSMSNKLKAI